MTLKGTRIKKFVRSEDAFTLVEMIIVVVMMALLLSIGWVLYLSSERNTNLKAAAEMLKQDIRKVYAAVDSGAAVKGNDGLWHKNQYKIEFHTSSDSPANCYHIMKNVWNTQSGAYSGWTVWSTNEFAPGHAASAIISNEWIKPSTASDIVIRDVSGSKSTKEITFLAVGSIVQTDAVGDVQIFLRSNSQNKETTITVSIFGSVQ